MKEPAQSRAESTRKLGELLRDVYTRNPESFRLFCPDETNSNRLGAVFEVSDRAFMERVTDDDTAIGRDGRVMEVLSEHNCHGWLEGYTLTGRHGMFATYEAFAMVSASQTVQHGKWLQEALHLPWRAKVPSRQLPAVGGRPLPALAVVHQSDRDRQAAAVAVADDGAGGRALRPGRRGLGVGRQRRRRPRPRHRAGLRR